MTCPICGAACKVVSVGAFGYRALCGECYEGDPEAPLYRHLDGMGGTREEATEEWLRNAREYAANEDIPSLPCPSRPRASGKTVVQEVVEQAREEFERQQRDGWHLIEVTFQTEDGELDAYYLDTEGACN